MGNADLHRLPQRFVADAQGVISPHGGILQWVFGPPRMSTLASTGSRGIREK